MIVQKTAQVSTYGNPQAKNVWIVLHGYGQLSRFFIRKFNVLKEQEHFIIAPEGLHRFYVQGTGGRVGASWMTKEERLTDIQDYIKYLDQLIQEYGVEDYEKIILVGFSQGAATSARWMEMGKIRPDIYVHWAGVFPPDLEFDPNHNVFGNTKNYYVVGEQDEYFTKEKVADELKNFEQKGIDVTYLSFNGPHTIDASILQRINNNLVGIS